MSTSLEVIIGILSTLLITFIGAHSSGVWVRSAELDRVRAILEVKQEVIDANERTIKTLEDNNLLLKAAAQATNGVLQTLKVVVQEGGTS